MGIAMLRAPFAIAAAAAMSAAAALAQVRKVLDAFLAHGPSAAEIRAAFARRVGAERNVTAVVGNGEN